jgi:hypothetical protein
VAGYPAAAGFRRNGRIRRALAESSISVSSRLSFVSGFFALTTHQMAALR